MGRASVDKRDAKDSVVVYFFFFFLLRGWGRGRVFFSLHFPLRRKTKEQKKGKSISLFQKPFSLFFCSI